MYKNNLWCFLSNSEDYFSQTIYILTETENSDPELFPLYLYKYFYITYRIL